MKLGMELGVELRLELGMETLITHHLNCLQLKDKIKGNYLRMIFISKSFNILQRKVGNFPTQSTK